jgi:hypothetical protein
MSQELNIINMLLSSTKEWRPLADESQSNRRYAQDSLSKMFIHKVQAKLNSNRGFWVANTWA